jgi:hypothetical protein
MDSQHFMWILYNCPYDNLVDFVVPIQRNGLILIAFLSGTCIIHCIE